MDDIPSLIYFGGIAKFNQTTFIKKLKSYSDELIEEDMFRQVHCLASALKRKFAKLRAVSFLLLAQFSAIIIFTIYIIIQIK